MGFSLLGHSFNGEQPGFGHGKFSRRHVIRTAIGAGASLSVVGLLAACGGSKSNNTPTTGSGTGSTTATTASGSTGASPASSSGSTGASPASSSGSSTATSASTNTAQQGGELFYALANKIDTLDPTITTFTDVVRIAVHMFDPLIWEAKAGEFIPGLAQKWEVNDTADKYTFHLRTDVKFHDGTAFNADAIKFTYDRIVDPASKSQVAFSQIGPYDSSTIVDPATVTVNFKKPFAPFLSSVSQVLLAPLSPTAVQKLGADFGIKPVGTGPFKFDSYKTDNVVRMVKNPDYKWAPSMFKHQGPPNLDAISWRIIPEAATRVAALQSGEVQFIQDVPTQDYSSLKSNNSVALLEGVMAGSGWSMMINVTKTPTDDVKLRQALEWGVDKVGMIKAIWQGLYQPASSPLTSVTFGYDPKTKDVYKYDATKAGQLLDEAGWKMSGDTRQKDGQSLTLEVYYRSDNPDFTAMATFLQSMYQQIGIKLNLNGLAQAGYFDAVRAGKHHLQFWWEPATDPDVVRELLYSANANGGTNRNRYKNADMDKLIDDAAGTTDPAKREAFYSQIQMKVLNEAIMVFFSDPTNVFAYQKSKVQGAVIDWSSTFPHFYDTSLSK
ncbi:MAG TPA: ABC transporter substrate-binding protein [Nitrolancea sp.]|nr:ABC transporter substrate-binding protein [Nitrolancea sp.]